jgi:hypothetical protein
VRFDLLFYWLALALIPAVLANSRGRSPVGWFLLGVVLTPFLAIILVLVIADLSVDADRHAELVDAIGGVGPDPVDRLERLAALHDRGVLTDEEFEATKASALERL